MFYEFSALFILAVYLFTHVHSVHTYLRIVHMYCVHESVCVCAYGLRVRVFQSSAVNTVFPLSHLVLSVDVM